MNMTPSINVNMIVLTCVLSSCHTYPQGMTKQQWDSLSPQQQAAYWRIETRNAREEEAISRQVKDTIRQVESMPKLKHTQDDAEYPPVK